MTKRYFAILIVICAVLTLLGFSAWQVQRLQWKQGLIAQYEVAAKATPVPVESTQQNYARVILRGEYLHDHELHLGGRRLYTKTGYHLLTPLKTAAGDIYLVNRGWIPMELKDAAKRPESLTQGEVEVSGMIRFPEKPGLFTPANHPEKNFWFTVNIPAMEQETGLKLMPFTVEVMDAEAKRDHFPVPSDGKVVLRNDHLGYAITWFCLAVAAGVIGWLRLRKPR